MDIFICARIFSVCMYMYVRLNAQSLITSSQLYTVFFYADYTALEFTDKHFSVLNSMSVGSSLKREFSDLPLTHIYIQSTDAFVAHN